MTLTAPSLPGVVCCRQEEYKKGVSSWNFDVAALKAQADLEDDEPLLPTISESEEREGAEDREDMTLTGFPSALAAEFLSATSQSQPQEAPTYISAFGERASNMCLCVELFERTC